MTVFRFQPRYRGLAMVAIAGGAALAAAPLVVIPEARWIAITLGCIGCLLGVLYLRSPTWRFEVRVDDESLEVVNGHGDRVFRLRWDEIERVIASAATSTCVVSGGTAETTLIVPGPGAPAPYAIDDRQALYDTIVRRAPADRIEQVDLIEHAAR